MNLSALAARQHGVVTTSQALACGLTEAGIDWRVRSGRWVRLHRGVLLMHTGEVTWLVRASAAVLGTGGSGGVCFAGAAYLHGLTPRPPGQIQIAVPRGRRSLAVPGIRVRERSSLVLARGSAWPPRTSVEDTVLDMGSVNPLDTAIAYAARGVQQRLTTVELMTTALAARRHHPWRQALQLVLGDIDDGAESVMEVRYVRGVERRHGLPHSQMQAPDHRGGIRVRRDFEYTEYQLVVEVDGRLGHVADGALRDRSRDRSAARSGRQTLRAGWVEVVHRRCELAADVAGTLRARGWRGTPRPCSPECAVGRSPVREFSR